MKESEKIEVSEKKDQSIFIIDFQRNEKGQTSVYLT
jgi:hypothetical protein